MSPYPDDFSPAAFDRHFGRSGAPEPVADDLARLIAAIEDDDVPAILSLVAKLRDVLADELYRPGILDEPLRHLDDIAAAAKWAHVRAYEREYLDDRLRDGRTARARRRGRPQWQRRLH